MRPAKKILVVDDELMIRDVVVALLEDEGYAVVAAHTGCGPWSSSPWSDRIW
ncbi:MAG: hypothetical protein M3Q03_11780 [Chloroflexota bacterium]|nr:hypothetical protein [Chloroflexota bacterium]